MSTLRLYLDEDITDVLARVLRARGFDVVSVHDVNLAGKTDVEQLEFACAQQRVLVSFNVKHFATLAQEYAAQG